MNAIAKKAGGFVISANYRDRSSSAKWLIRDKNQEPEVATPESAIIAQNVVFKDSDQYEYGFGCSVIAEAEFSSVVNNLTSPDDYFRLHFDGYKFHTGTNLDDLKSDDFAYVNGVQVLHLHADGSMLALI